jgi:hypothetical protein
MQNHYNILLQAKNVKMTDSTSNTVDACLLIGQTALQLSSSSSRVGKAKTECLDGSDTRTPTQRLLDPVDTAVNFQSSNCSLWHT